MEALEVKAASAFQQAMCMQKSRHFFDRRNLFGSGGQQQFLGWKQKEEFSLSPSPLFLRRLQCACVHARARKPYRPTSNLAHWKPTRARVVMQCSACTHLRYTHMCARARNRLSNSYVFSTFYLLHMYLMKNKNVLKRNSCPLSRNTHTEATPPKSFCAKISPPPPPTPSLS